MLVVRTSTLQVFPILHYMFQVRFERNIFKEMSYWNTFENRNKTEIFSQTHRELGNLCRQQVFMKSDQFSTIRHDT